MSTHSEPISILIAEDNPTQAERLRQILEGEGYGVAEAHNGRVALEMLQSARPSLIISDVVLPEIDGYELSRRVKENPAYDTIPVILVTTMSDAADVLRGLECGAENFVLKPYEADYLLECVRHALISHSERRAEAPCTPVEVTFNGETHAITANRLQILNLLLSTYAAAIERNKELQRSREELQNVNTRLNQANKDLEAFSYSASHDLRAPLRHISGFSTLLMEETQSQLSPKAVRYLADISGAARRMAQLIQDLLEFSRMERASMQQARVDMNLLVRRCIAELTVASAEQRVSWRVGQLSPVTGDPAMLRQVFINLLGNALKYSGGRERALIEVGTSTETEAEVVMFVRDNGVGFDMKHADKLFQAFQRLHGPDDFEGTGIGLATVRRIVARHGGRVWAEAAPDQGATFYVGLKPATPEK
jgi:hypothetical protein